MKDPAFLFYPGDYLRDTQCLSEKSQVAYDRIMCEHMRNICISKQQLNFFTKRLNEDEKQELMFLLTEKDDGFQILWVAESIEKRRKYSDSRRNNRKAGVRKDMITYDAHMENENTYSYKEDNKEIKEEKKKSSDIDKREQVAPSEITKLYPHAYQPDKTLDDCKADLLKDQHWLEQVAMSNGIRDIRVVEVSLVKFFLTLAGDGITHKGVGDAKRHFNRWLPKNKDSDTVGAKPKPANGYVPVSSYGPDFDPKTQKF